MKLLSLFTLAATALAVPTPDAPSAKPIVDQFLVKRQGKGLGGRSIRLLFARGTTEPGTMGTTVGPALTRALSAKYPGTKGEGVAYPADFGGAFSGGTNPKGAAGSIKMAAMAKTELAAGHLVVLAGYSQGAEQVHGALLNLGPDGAKIAAAVTFGDPLKVAVGKYPVWGKLPDARAKLFCNSGDGVCGGAFSISAAHLSYTSNGDIGKAVDFITGAIAAMDAAPAAPSEGSEGGGSTPSTPSPPPPSPKGKGKGKIPGKF